MKIDGVVKILEYYTANQLILNEQAILDIITAFLNENNMMEIISDIKFCNLHHLGYDAIYDKNSKNIYFDFPKIFDDSINKYYRQNVNIPAFQFVNQQIIILIFHELAHAIFFAVPNFANVVSRNIINYILGIIKTENVFDTSKHDYFPHEREANAFAYRICLSVYQLINKSFVDDETIRNLYISTLEMLLKGYNGGYDNPLRKIVTAFSQSDLVDRNYYLMQQDIALSNMSLCERLKYGFPITYEEEVYLKNILIYYKFYSCNFNSDMDKNKFILSR